MPARALVHQLLGAEDDLVLEQRVLRAGAIKLREGGGVAVDRPALAHDAAAGQRQHGHRPQRQAGLEGAEFLERHELVLVGHLGGAEADAGNEGPARERKVREDVRHGGWERGARYAKHISDCTFPSYYTIISSVSEKAHY